MTILAFDTASVYLDIALRHEGVFYTRYEKIGLSHSEHLLPAIKELCGEAGITLSEISLIFCSRGPGSFTGLRIGMSSAKGLALGNSLPILSLSSLEMYQAAALSEKPVIPVIDARKKRFYTAVFHHGVPLTKTLDIGAAQLIKDHLAHLEGGLITGPDCDLLLKEITDLDPNLAAAYSSTGPLPAARLMLEIGEARFTESGGDSKNQGPEYIRSSV